MKPLFTIHAGEFLVNHEIQRRFPRVNVWVPAKDTGVDLLASDGRNRRTVSLQVKFSRDYLVTHVTRAKQALLNQELRACGWWTLSRKQIENSTAGYWVFVLVGFANRTTDFIVIKPRVLLRRLDAIHGKTSTFQCYLWVTRSGKCWETRGLKRAEHLSLAANRFKNASRNFSGYLNNWKPIRALSST